MRPLTLVLILICSLSTMSVRDGREGVLPRNSQRRKRKRPQLLKTSTSILEMIPTLDLYIGPEQVCSCLLKLLLKSHSKNLNA